MLRRGLGLLVVGIAASLALTGCQGASVASPTVPQPATLEQTPTTAPSPTPPPRPRGAAEAYLGAWRAADYAAMHALTDGSTPLADFEKQVRDLLRLMTVTGLSTEITDAAEAGSPAEVTVHVTYDTILVGALEADVTLPLTQQAGEWRVAFSPALIWPELVNGQQLLMVPLIPERGDIYDRSGAPLVAAADAYAIGLVPGEIADYATVDTGLAGLLGTRPERIAELYEFAPLDQYLPVAEVSAAEVGSRYNYLFSVPGIAWSPYNGRYYFGRGATAHVTGYTAFIPPDQVEAYQARGYTGSERIGAAGLEALGEAYLAGKVGAQLQLRNANNEFIRMVAARPIAAAQDVYSTIDLDLQKAAQFALGDFSGAIVVLDPESGQVLALAASPTYSPNLFDLNNRNAGALNAVLQDQRRPLVNRTTQATYPAGSVFKIVTMAAGLRSGLFTPDTGYFCTGQWSELGPTFVRDDWLEDGHGQITLVEGLAGSCNTYFWHIGLALFNFDPAWLSQTATAFGFGARTGIGIDEAPGQIPSPEWKQQTRGEAWTAIDNLNLSIGQGEMLVTPLQIARLAAAVGNGGTLYQPQLVLRVAAPDAAPVFEFAPIAAGQLPLLPEQIAAIQEGMRLVTQEPRGTARNRFRNFRIPVAGKTGTAEDPGLFGTQKPAAWFAGYTLAGRSDRPDIAVAVVLDNQGQGSDFAAPVFRRVVESYFGLTLTRYPWESAVGVVAEPTPTPDPNASPTP